MNPGLKPSVDMAGIRSRSVFFCEEIIMRRNSHRLIVKHSRRHYVVSCFPMWKLGKLWSYFLLCPILTWLHGMLMLRETLLPAPRVFYNAVIMKVWSIDSSVVYRWWNILPIPPAFCFLSSHNHLPFQAFFFSFFSIFNYLNTFLLAPAASLSFNFTSFKQPFISLYISHHAALQCSRLNLAARSRH